jgi:hypothetical protein
MKRIGRQIGSCAIACLWVVLAACVKHVVAPPPVEVVVPPAVDLRGFGKVGIIELSSNTRGNLQQFATQKLIETIQSAQPGTRILELGNEERVLRSVESRELGFETIQAIGKRYGVEALLVGHLNVTDVKPRFQLSTFLESMSARADVEAFLSARLLETESGATLWTNSAKTRETVAHVHVIPHGPADFGASDPEDAYGRLVQVLVQDITEDFHARYEYKYP